VRRIADVVNKIFLACQCECDVENAPRSCDPNLAFLCILWKAKEAARLSHRIMVAFESETHTHFTLITLFTPVNAVRKYNSVLPVAMDTNGLIYISASACPAYTAENLISRHENPKLSGD